MRQFIAAGPANLAREQAAARQAGIPLDASQLQKPLPPPSQNAAPIYVKLTKLLKDKPLNLPKYAAGMYVSHSYTPAQIATIHKLLASRQDVMMLVHEAADKPQCVFVRDWNKGPKLEFPEYQPMREAARLIETESYLLARDGHYQEAIANQTRGFRVAEHAASDPQMIAYLVGNANEAITLSGMQSILALAGPNPNVDISVQGAVAAKHSRLSLRGALSGETGFFYAGFARMHKVEKDGIPAAFAAAGFPDGEARKVEMPEAAQQRFHNLIDAWEADYLARTVPAIVASNQALRIRQAVFTSTDRIREQDSNNGEDIRHLFTDLYIPTFSKMAENDTRIHARESVTLAAAAILGLKAKSGAFPDKLPPEFTDPFTNKPLQYQREGDTGFVVYSVGPTGRFDGGKPGQKAPGTESLFRYPAVAIPIPPEDQK